MKQLNVTRAFLVAKDARYIFDVKERYWKTTGKGNKIWLEEKVKARKVNLEEKVELLKAKHNNIRMDIERLEEEESNIGPRQKKFKESCKKLGINPAIYHGGDLEGKAVQTLLDSARLERNFEKV